MNIVSRILKVSVVHLALAQPLMSAEVKIVEYPDRIVAELVGTLDKKTTPAEADNAQEEPEERRISLIASMQRLQKERQELTKRLEWEPPEETKRKRDEAQEKMREIGRISEELKELGKRQAQQNQ